MWAVVPVARRDSYADELKTSAVKDITAPELADFKAGVFLEKTETTNYPAGTSIATIQANLITNFNTFQAQVTAANPWRYYGTSWDGTSWDVKTTN